MWFQKKQIQRIESIGGFTLGQIVRHKITGGRYAITKLYCHDGSPFALADDGPYDKNEFTLSIYEIEPAPSVDAGGLSLTEPVAVHAR